MAKMQPTKVIEGRTERIKLTIIHEGARVNVFYPWELEKKKNSVLALFKALLKD